MKNEVTLDDLRQKLAQINQALTREVKNRKGEIYAVAAASVAAAIFLSYYFGKRRGGRRK